MFWIIYQVIADAYLQSAPYLQMLYDWLHRWSP